MYGKTLKLVRQYHRLSLSQGAERVVLSKSFVSELENGRKRVSLEVLEKYSVAFRIPLSSLVLFDELKEEPNFSERFRFFAADKALKMLEWIHDTSDIEE